MKYYDYSVRELLSSFFGNNALFEMRRTHYSSSLNKAEKLLPRLWQYADEHMLDMFTEEVFLLDTALEDDYIAYMAQVGDKRRVYLMFMVTEDEPFFHMDVEYVKELSAEWEVKGYSVLILRVCIEVNYHGKSQEDGFHFHTKDGRGSGIALYNLQHMNGEDILVFTTDPCWQYYNRKLIFLSRTDSLQEYKCVFDPDVRISEGDEPEKRTLAAGIEAVMDLLHKGPIRIGYYEFGDTKTYFPRLYQNGRKLVPFVNRRNLICELCISPCTENIILDEEDNSYGSLIDAIPGLLTVRKLDPEIMHGYTLQLTFSDRSVRNYYLKCFEDREIPQQCMIEGYSFTREDFFSAEADSAGNVSFQNGFCIPGYYLYYLSYRQGSIEYDDSVVYKDEEITIQSLYRLPFEDMGGRHNSSHYNRWPEESFGPNKPCIDGSGKRTSDIALWSESGPDGCLSGNQVCVEPSWKYGFLNGDGTWLVPPVYDSFKPFSTDYMKAVRRIDGEERTFLIDAQGGEKPYPFDSDIEFLSGEPACFNAEKWDGPIPDPGYTYYDSDYPRPGKWGYINHEGKVVVEPQYVYAVDFEKCDGEHALVARLAEKKVMWGIIDRSGREVLPCTYPCLYSLWGAGIAFQEEENGLSGLMDFEGNVILEPKFAYIEDYDQGHRLVTAGNDEYDLGVYSLDLGQMIIPTGFEYVDYGDRIITCEISWTCENKYFDYAGREISFDEYDSVSEDKGLLRVLKDGKAGLIDWEGNTIIPPVLDHLWDFHVDLYRRGFYISCSQNLKGLARADGTVILPEIYSSINICGDLLIASVRTGTNRSIKDTLFTIDGKLILEGQYKKMDINEDGTMSVLTPSGKQFFKITRTASRQNP